MAGRYGLSAAKHVGGERGGGERDCDGGGFFGGSSTLVFVDVYARAEVVLLFTVVRLEGGVEGRALVK